MEILNTLHQTYLKDFKNQLESEFSKRRMVTTGYHWGENGKSVAINQEVPILSDSLERILKRLLSFFRHKYFLDNITDSGSCTLGECLYIHVAKEGQGTKTNFPVIKQQFQGSTSSVEHFNRVREFLQVVHPEFNAIVHYDCGSMD